MTNTLELELAIKRAGLTKKDIAQQMKLSKTSLYKKINNDTEFKASEIYKLSKILELEDIEAKENIFFDNKVDFKSPKRTTA